MSGESITEHELMTLFEAARWAPSSYNNQPWRFIYAMRDDAYWDTFFDILVPFNQQWCKRAAVLVCIVSAKNFAASGKFSQTHSFDTGAAWENLSLQGAAMDLVVHCLEGFSYEKARTQFQVSDEYDIEAMCAIGRPAPEDVLSEGLQEKEKKSDRKPLSSIVFHGALKEQ
jgi:nitroreductase